MSLGRQPDPSDAAEAEAELNAIYQEAKRLETSLITTKEALHLIVTTKNINDLALVWAQLKYDAHLSEDPEKAKRFYLALINAAFRLNAPKDCFSYYQEANKNGLVDGALHRTMFRISAAYRDIENLELFYSILKDTNEVQPMDHYQAMLTLNKLGYCKEAGKISREYMHALKAATNNLLAGHANSLFNQPSKQKAEEIAVVASSSDTATNARRKIQQ